MNLCMPFMERSIVLKMIQNVLWLMPKEKETLQFKTDCVIAVDDNSTTHVLIL